ncbi:MAG: hypothetical protein ABS70_06900 [Nitrospira sp. SCN 59-13]|nr:MAG: hypothetical protein ABS70_06900 [Nitrospira sp. SCN 59-13]
MKSYKSRRADPDEWILGGYATKEVIDRAKFQPHLVGQGITAEDVAFLGVDPGPDIDEAWWEEMLVAWFGAPEDEEANEATEEETSSETATENHPART